MGILSDKIVNQVLKETKTKVLCGMYLFEHKEMARFKSGFANPSPCYCEGCRLHENF